MHTLIAGGEEYIDIDSYACLIALAELFALERRAVSALVPDTINYSVPHSLVVSNEHIVTQCPGESYEAYVVDLSNPDDMASCVDRKKIVGIFDHHHGFEEYWQDRLGERAVIEMIGAAATLIWEEWGRRELKSDILPATARLLAFAIASNTGNFGISITSSRDRDAFAELSVIAVEREGWTEALFREVDRQALADIHTTLRLDTKIAEYPNMGAVSAGQLELWDGASFFQRHMSVVDEVLDTFGAPRWFMSVPCLSEQRNYLYTKDRELQELLSRFTNAVFDEHGLAVTDRLIYRKELYKQFMS